MTYYRHGMKQEQFYNICLALPSGNLHRIRKLLWQWQMQSPDRTL